MSHNSIDRIYRSIEWFEDHIDDVSEGRIQMADIACFSPYHYGRVFYSMTGMSPALYCRRRMLTKAAQGVLLSERSILDIALEAGYETQESFTRAFKEMFHVNPGEARKRQKDLVTLYQKPLEYDALNHIDSGGLELKPDYREHKEISISGVSGDIDYDGVWQANKIWEEYLSQTRKSPTLRYGVCRGTVEGHMPASRLNYLAGHEGKNEEGFDTALLEARSYVVFVHDGNVQNMLTTLQYIWQIWVPKNDIVLREAPDFEIYGKSFDEKALKGKIEIWIPVAN